MSIFTKEKKPLYLASYTVRDKVAQCDLCPFQTAVVDVRLMHVHVDRHINGGWIGS